MADFSVKIDNLRYNSENLSGYKADTRLIAEGIKTVRSGLNLGDSDITGALVRRAIMAETDILSEAVQAENLAKALEYIGERYVQCEKDIINGKPGLKKILKDLFVELIKLLGLDEDYYHCKMGYEEFDADRTQEKLMDHYMSDACQNLLNEDRYSEKRWNNASPDERKAMLNSFILEINEIMGTDVDKTVNYADLDSSTRGYYDPDANSVTINTDYLATSMADSYMIMRTMIHEMRHCYQHQAVENPEKFMVSKETLKKWEENFKPGKYKNAQKDGYEAYVTQPIEWDAKNFAKQKNDVKGYTPEYAGSW